VNAPQAPRSDWPKLAPAPRELPPSYALGVLCGDPLMQAGLLLLLFALVPLWGVLPYADAASLWRYRGELELANARITHVEQTSATEGGRKRKPGTPVQRIDFEFEREGTLIAGTSYGPVAPPEVGAQVEIEYPSAQPQHARIRGLRSDLFGPAALLTLLFPLVGLVLCVVALVRAARVSELAKKGRSALGRTQELKFLRTRKRREYHRASYAFTVDGTDFRGTRDTTAKALYEDARGLRVLHDPQRPQRHELVDELPVPPQVDALGRVQPIPARKLVPMLILPVLVDVGYLAWMLAMALR